MSSSSEICSPTTTIISVLFKAISNTKETTHVVVRQVDELELGKGQVEAGRRLVVFVEDERRRVSHLTSLLGYVGRRGDVWLKYLLGGRGIVSAKVVVVVLDGSDVADLLGLLVGGILGASLLHHRLHRIRIRLLLLLLVLFLVLFEYERVAERVRVAQVHLARRPLHLLDHDLVGRQLMVRMMMRHMKVVIVMRSRRVGFD